MVSSALLVIRERCDREEIEIVARENPRYQKINKMWELRSHGVVVEDMTGVRLFVFR